MFEAGDKRAIDAAIGGSLACPYHNDLSRYPNITEVDRAGIFLPSTEEKISQSQSVRSRTFRSIEDPINLFAFRRPNARGCTGVRTSSGGHCLPMLLPGIQLQVFVIRKDQTEPR